MQSKTEMNSIVHVLAWMGLSSVEPYLREKCRLYKTLIFVPITIQAIILLVEIFLVLAYPLQFFHHSTKMGQFTDILQVGGVLITGFVQIVENILKYSLHQKIGKMIFAIDETIFARHLCTKLPSCSFCKRRSLLPYLINRGFFLIFVAFLIDIIIITSIPEVEKVWKQSIIVREFTMNMIRIGMFQINCYFYWVGIFKISKLSTQI